MSVSEAVLSPPNIQAIHKAVQLALDEDLACGDVTTNALFPRALAARATIIAHQVMTVAGIAVAREVFLTVDPSLRITEPLADGTRVKAETAIMEVDGDVRSLLMAERVAVNFLQRLSGIATLTAQFCSAVGTSAARILDTRKTTPGLRALEKWAVALGKESSILAGRRDFDQGQPPGSLTLPRCRRRRRLPSSQGWRTPWSAHRSRSEDARRGEGGPRGKSRHHSSRQYVTRPRAPGRRLDQGADSRGGVRRHHARYG